MSDTNCVDLEVIQNIGRRVLIVTDKCPQLMRGVDYRSKCIDMLLLSDLDNERAYRQALGRVGRFGDHCTRWKLRGLVGYSVEKQRLL